MINRFIILKTSVDLKKKSDSFQRGSKGVQNRENSSKRYLKLPRVGAEEIKETTIDLNISFLKTSEKEHLLLDIILNLKWL